MSPSLNVNLTLFVIPFFKIGIINLQCRIDCHFLSEFSIKFQSPMTILHCINVTMQNTPKFVTIIGIWMNKKQVGMTALVNLFIENVMRNITLSSNARRVPFEYPQIYLNKKGKVCKARVNERKYRSFKKVSKRFSMRGSGDFSKKCNYLFDLSNFPVAL